MAADDVRAVREALRMTVVRRLQQQYGGIDRAAGNDHEVRAEVDGRPVDLGHDCETVRPVVSVSSRTTLAFVTIETLSCFSAGSTQITCASDFRLRQAREPVHLVAPDTGAVPGRPALLVLDEIDADRQMERCSPCFSRSSLNCWMRGSCSTGPNRYGALAAPSVGSSPRRPCTR